jgi:hypothetical protein
MSLLFKNKNFDTYGIGVGASIPLPGSISPEIIEAGFSLRKERLLSGELRNKYLGSVITHPTPDNFVFSDAYFDSKDNQYDETFFQYNKENNEWKRFQGNELEKEYRELGFYKNAHKGDKRYLVVNQFVAQLINLISLKNGN